VLTYISGGYSEVDKISCNYLAGTETESPTPPPLTLYQNYPNPFNPTTSIRFYLSRRAPVTLDIYDVSGRLVTRLVRSERDEGYHVVQWNGLDGDGTPVSSGVYLSVLTVRGRSVSRKIVLAR
jgi:hypothetical protein